jgi:hypothetical protein
MSQILTHWEIIPRRPDSLAGGPGFEPGLTESESAVLPLNYPPTRWKAKFGRMDVSEARRGQRLEIDHKEIARRNTQLESDKFDCHLATPLLAAPGEALGESIDLIVVATGKREQLSDEFFQPSGAPGRRTDPPANRSVWAINRARLSVSGL